MTLTIMDGLGTYLKNLRELRGISQTALATAVGLSRSHLGQIESGKISLPGPEIRRSLARKLGVSHLDLLIAAREITEDEIAKAGVEGVQPVDPERQALIDRLMRVRLTGDRGELLESILDRYLRLDRKAAEAVEHPPDKVHH
jgi:transcriptional regulator with XRE-family HTH domain